MDNPYYKKANSKEKVMKELEAQRGKYDETLNLWNAKQAELKLKREENRKEYQKNKKVNPDAERGPNKTDFYDQF